MVVSNVGPFANEYKVAQALVFGMAALPLLRTTTPYFAARAAGRTSVGTIVGPIRNA